jgi:gentisate 1,2-dioxygenase
MEPVDWKPVRTSSPVFNYPCARSRAALETLSRNEDPDPCHGYKLRYINPATGGSPMPTIGTFLALLPDGFTMAPYRSTDGTVYSVVEGTGETVIGDTAIRWKHRAATDAVLFSFSDRPTQQALSLWREERSIV